MKVVYVPWLHMHQPLIWIKMKNKEKLVSNLYKMLISKDQKEAWDARLIARAYKNPAKYVKKLREEGFKPKIMVDYSGILLESLVELAKEKVLDKIEVDGEKIGNPIKLFKEILRKYPDSIEFAGTAYSHCYFPATPVQDWKLQIEEWRNTFRKIFGKKNLERIKGFWLPEMGIPGFGDKLEKLIKIISEYYEWCILPLQAVEGYEKLSYEQKLQFACQPHLLKVKDASIPIIFRIPTYFIDQQAGCELNLLYSKLREAGKIFEKVGNKPALVVPASDGENGNVMMNEFFPKTFVPFFKEIKDKNIFSLTITQFLHTYYEKDGKISPKNEIKLKEIGASWVGGHKFWLEGSERLEMVKKIERLSKRFWEIKDFLKENEFSEIKRMLLIAETSCYVYWGIDFWFTQGKKTIKFVNEMLDRLIKKR